uniref:Uncharacterized protein n=1 Tax=Ciona savignyi TaxID=51511 RepID=H2YST1_CIOSA
MLCQSNNSAQNSLNHLGKALLEAAKLGNDDEVRQLLTQGAPFITDWLGYSSLHFACMNGHKSTAEILTRAGVSWEGRTKADKTPLHFAAQCGYRDTVQYLCKLGADINARDMLNMTPLHWAVAEQHFLVVKFLVECKADVNIKSKFDKTPLDIAQDNADYHFIQFLKSAARKYSTFTDTESPCTSDSTSAFENLSSHSDSNFQRDYLGSNVASGAPVLLEGANQITLTEAGKLALQNWSTLFEQAENNNDMVGKHENGIETIDDLIEKNNQQKFLTITLGNQIFTSVSTEQSNQSHSFAYTSPTKKLTGAKRKKATEITSPKKILKPSSKNGNATLQRQLTAARTKAEEFQEKLDQKEREIESYKHQLEELLQHAKV